MEISKLIQYLKSVDQGSSEIDIMCMKVFEEAPDDAIVAGKHWLLPCGHVMPCACQYGRIGIIIQRTRLIDTTEDISGCWTSLVRESWPTNFEWTARIGGPISQIKGIHKSLPIARTIAILRQKSIMIMSH